MRRLRYFPKTGGVLLRSAMDDILRNKLRAWAKSKPTVRALYVFGSRARGNNRPDSDLDLAFDLEERYGNQLSELVSNADAWRGELAGLTGLRIKDLILSSDPEASERLLIFRREGAG